MFTLITMFRINLMSNLTFHEILKTLFSNHANIPATNFSKLVKLGHTDIVIKR